MSQKYNRKNTQLTTAETFDPSRVTFIPPKAGEVPPANSKAQPIRFHRIYIHYTNPDGSVADLVMRTPEGVFSPGVKENVNDNGEVTGHAMPVILYDKDGPTPEQKKWVEVFEKFVDMCRSALLKHKNAMGKHRLTKEALKELSPLYWPRDDEGNVVENRSPSVYFKIIEVKKTGKVVTRFAKASGRTIPMHKLIDKYMTTTAAVKFEHIFVGSKIISIQLKVTEAEVELIENSTPSLLLKKDSNEEKEEDEMSEDPPSEVEVDSGEDSDDSPKPPRSSGRK